MLLNKIMGIIDNSEIVSFDIFDTLVTRIYDKPVDLFRHLEESTRRDGFYNARISAESIARSKAFELGKKEITLNDIYAEIHHSYKDLITLEIEAEYIACRANPEMKEVYEYIKSRNKKIIIASDMYLPMDVIVNILDNCGYIGYDRIYLSSSIMKTKISGDMYTEILNDYKVLPEQILHIGDNHISDIEMARKAGINAYSYIPFNENYGTIINSNYVTTLRKYSYKSVVPSIITGLISFVEYQEDKSYWYKFGYKYAGIILHGYAKWLKKQFDKENINKVFFMLRDGYLTKQVMDIMYPELKTSFVYGSRRLFLLAGLSNIDSLLVYLTKSFTDGLTYKELYDRVMFDDDCLQMEYEKAFPLQDQPITSNEQLKKIETFFKEKYEDLMKIGDKERKILIDYLDQIGITEGKNAVVDLGWRGSMLRNIEQICLKENRNSNLFGYYVATHPHKSNSHMLAYIMNNGMPNNVLPYSVFATSAYVMNIIELIFSAPHPSIVKMEYREGKIVPVFQKVTEAEQVRMDTFNEICKGTIDFVKDFKVIDEKNPVEITAEVSAISMEYFSNHVSKYDEKQIAMVDYVPGIGNDATSFPINKNTKFTIGLINPWSGDQTAEAEVIRRIEKAAAAAGVVTVKLSTSGKILDSNFDEYPDYVEGKVLDCAISFNYHTIKNIDTFYYHTLWSPPEMSLGQKDYVNRLSDNILMNDDYLIYDFGGMSKHLKAILYKKYRNIDNCSTLTASFPKSVMMQPKLENMTIFYCGMNWEKIDAVQGRHDGLFRLLDDSGIIKFYGPNYVEAWGGINPWEGYNCYQKPLPFDGFSILHEINKCGICLVISSDIHRRAGAVTNRTYEACVAGALMISDENPWMEHYFKDAALFIKYNKNNPTDTFNQIREKYEWALSHREEAMAMVKRAQKIFCDNFALEHQLRNLAHNHSHRFKSIEKDLFALSNDKRVLVTYVVNTIDTSFAKNNLHVVINNVENQYYRNICIGIACDFSIAHDIQHYCDSITSKAKVIPMNIFDCCGSKDMTDGKAIRNIVKNIQHDYVIHTSADELWFYDHITTLVRTIEEAPNIVGAYSGRLIEDMGGIRKVDFFDYITRSSLYDIDGNDTLASPGQILFKSCEQDDIEDYIFDYIDKMEQYAYALWLCSKDNKDIRFSARMTFVYKQVSRENNTTILSRAMQIRLLQDIFKPFYHIQNIGYGTIMEVPSKTCTSNQSISRIFLNFPIKSWLKVRYYRMKLRNTKPGSDKFKKLSKKYEASVGLYNQQINSL